MGNGFINKAEELYNIVGIETKQMFCNLYCYPIDELKAIKLLKLLLEKGFILNLQKLNDMWEITDGIGIYNSSEPSLNEAIASVLIQIIKDDIIDIKTDVKIVLEEL